MRRFWNLGANLWSSVSVIRTGSLGGIYGRASIGQWAKQDRLFVHGQGL